MNDETPIETAPAIEAEKPAPEEISAPVEIPAENDDPAWEDPLFVIGVEQAKEETASHFDRVAAEVAELTAAAKEIALARKAEAKAKAKD